MMSKASLDLKLPSLSVIIRECMARLYSGEPDSFALAAYIQKDPGLASCVLKLANSVSYSTLGKPTSDISAGITRIGLTALMQILVKNSLENMFHFEAIGFFDIKSFMKHSTWVSQVAIELGKLCQSKHISDLLIAGLMHDVGYLVRCLFDRSTMEQIVQKSISSRISLHEAERVLGVSLHEEFTEMILNHWRLPSEIILFTKYHHTSEAERPLTLSIEDNKNINILNISDTISYRFSNAFQNYPGDIRISNRELERLSITNTEIIAATKVAANILQNL